MDLRSLTFKESKMTADNQAMMGSEERNGKVSLEMLAKLTGFPVELIKEEIFQGENTDQVSLEDLRSAMLSYIDTTMLMSEEK
jgi:hypothetical protein